MKKKIIITIILAYCLGMITMTIIDITHKKALENRVIYTITINEEFINLRKDIDLSDTPIRKVYKGEQYKVIEYYEGNLYNWYKVLYDDTNTGWVASGKEEPWVIIER